MRAEKTVCSLILHCGATAKIKIGVATRMRVGQQRVAFSKNGPLGGQLSSQGAAWLRRVGVIDYERTNGIGSDHPGHRYSKRQDCSPYPVQTVTTKHKMNLESKNSAGHAEMI